MNKKLEKKFDEEFKDDENVLFAVGVKDNVKAFIDEHFIAKEEVNTWNTEKNEFETEIREVYTQEQVLEIIGEDKYKDEFVVRSGQGEQKAYETGFREGHNQAKAEARERLNKQRGSLNGLLE